MEEESDLIKKRRLARNTIWQQQLCSWRPIVTPCCLSSIFTTVGILYVITGAAILNAAENTIEVSKQYDGLCQLNTTCSFTVDIKEDMDSPVYFYYKLVNFYQNHRSYVMDFDIDQLQGEVEDIDSCTMDAARKNEGKSIYPCGLIANSFFNDIFSATLTSGGTTMALSGSDWDGSDISWESDRETKFKNFSGTLPDSVTRIGSEGNELPLPTDQDFQVWFRVAGLPRFNKLYRKIGTTSLKAGDVLTVTVQNNFDVSEFDGEKHVFLSTVSGMGGRNVFLGACYLTTGLICLLYALAMGLKRYFCPRTLGQMKYYEWTGLGLGPKSQRGRRSP